MSLSAKQRKFTKMVGEFIGEAYKIEGYSLTLGHVWRSNEEQTRLVAEGMSKTTKSKHLDRLAIDTNLFINGKYVTDRDAYRPLGEIWEKMGGTWGGRFGVKDEDYDTKVGWDPGHFEYKE